VTQKKPRILIVDDSPANIQVLNVILQNEYEVFFAESGAGALAKARGDRPDLILLDIMMPTMDGYEVCRRLKADAATRDIPVIFVSALSDDEDESKGFESGAVDYVTKPFRMPTIKARIKTHLELRRHQSALERLVKERTDELLQAYERLKILEQTKSDLLTSVSHELRTPLTSLLGFAQMTEKKLHASIVPAILEGGDPGRLQVVRQIEENLAVILEEGRRLTQIINNVMDLMQLVSESMKLRLQPVSLAHVVERAAAGVKRQFQRKHLILNIELDPDLPKIMADPDRLSQVLVNLLDNGAKFTRQGSVTVSASQKDDMAAITVRDEGIGIAEEHHGMIFEKFSQIGDVLTEKPTGLGIGLTISKKIVELHGGTMRIESVPGKGSAFTLTVPKAS
jgi:two-component system, sensor histidine kinase and response regulator